MVSNPLPFRRFAPDFETGEMVSERSNSFRIPKHTEVPPASKRLVAIANVLVNDFSLAVSLLEELHRQYASLVIDPRTDSKGARRNGRDPGRNLAEIYHERNRSKIFDLADIQIAETLNLYGIWEDGNFLCAIPSISFSVDYDDYTIRFIEFIEAINTARDAGNRIAFDEKVLVGAQEALETQDPDAVYEASQRIGEQVLRYKYACELTTVSRSSATETAVQGQKMYSVGELKEATGLGNDTLKKYGKPALGRWIGRGKRGKQFTEMDAIKIVKAVQIGSTEAKVQKQCSSWLEKRNPK